jgi:hypothetical protein
MGFRTIFIALCRRELGRRYGLVLIGWLLLGAGAALSHAWLSAGQPLHTPVVRLLGDFPVTLATVLAFVAAFQLIVRTAEDRLHGWLPGWCGSGGRRDGYVSALYLATGGAMVAVFGSSVAGFAITRAALGDGARLVRTPVQFLVGVLLIGGVGAYGLVLATLLQRVAAALLLGALLFIAPVIAGAVLAVTHDLPGLPASARFWILHLPSPWPVSSGTGLVRQISYIAVAVAVSAWVARYRIGRSA